jgi:lipopolysaccharide biosynthesis regulator YciM
MELGFWPSVTPRPCSNPGLARVNLYMATRKWDMAAAIARHLVEVEPENAAWWINLAYSVRRSETIEKAEAILLKAHAIHPRNVELRERYRPH